MRVVGRYLNCLDTTDKLFLLEKETHLILNLSDPLKKFLYPVLRMRSILKNRWADATKE